MEMELLDVAGKVLARLPYDDRRGDAHGDVIECGMPVRANLVTPDGEHYSSSVGSPGSGCGVTISLLDLHRGMFISAYGVRVKKAGVWTKL